MGDYSARWLFIAGDAPVGAVALVVLGSGLDAGSAWSRLEFVLLLCGAYDSLFYRPFVALLVGSVLRTGERNREVIWLTAWGWSSASPFPPLRPRWGWASAPASPTQRPPRKSGGGGWSVVDYDRFQGVVTFPSFHTASAVFLIYVARRSPWTLCVSAPLNLTMIVATPLGGGHYLVDLLAGAAVAAACIFLVRRMEHRGANAAAAPQVPRTAVHMEGSLSPG